MLFPKVRAVAAIFTVVSMTFLTSTAAFSKTYKMALGDAQGGTTWNLASKFSEIFQEKVGGKHKITIFPNGQLGSEQDTINDAAMGTLDFSLVAVNNITPFSPTLGALTLPYVIQSLDDAIALTHGPIGKELTENTIRDAGVRIVGWTYSGFRVLTNSKKPVETPADLDGLVIRVPKNAIMIDTFKAWGCNPTPMAWSETFTALQQKVVDGQDNPLITINTMKFYEVQKYVTSIRYIFSLEPLVVSETIFQDMKPEIQNAILEAGQEASLNSQQFLIDTEEQIRLNLLEKGMVISAPADNEKEWIEMATTKVWPKYYDSIGGKAKFDEMLKTLGR